MEKVFPSFLIAQTCNAVPGFDSRGPLCSPPARKNAKTTSEVDNSAGSTQKENSQIKLILGGLLSFFIKRYHDTSHLRHVTTNERSEAFLAGTFNLFLPFLCLSPSHRPTVLTSWLESMNIAKKISSLWLACWLWLKPALWTLGINRQAFVQQFIDIDRALDPFFAINVPSSFMRLHYRSQEALHRVLEASSCLRMNIWSRSHRVPFINRRRAKYRLLLHTLANRFIASTFTRGIWRCLPFLLVLLSALTKNITAQWQDQCLAGKHWRSRAQGASDLRCLHHHPGRRRMKNRWK